MLFEVVGRDAEALRVVIERSEPDVARMTEKGTYCVCIVVVIDVKVFSSTPSLGGRSFAYRAYAVLCRKE